ncbi:hypothetical protein OG819_56945 [Streptomyces sp. NBC_01549]|uniref:hypothetical protein n=1 Tax=Streptomyces sp. NBC_01549 TaxID=2975874 RepID=UPI0022503BB3|nr:hypothetical protein [Streptomyces sp. NBC_01549]MCX4598618.1 hypothetical protein [Streptomyces sp. NBC_01549]
MPAPGRRRRAEHAQRGMLERLLRQYASEVDWWRHGIWSLWLDRRTPRREHEPRANTPVRRGDSILLWLREGTKFYLRPQNGIRAADLVDGDAARRALEPPPDDHVLICCAQPSTDVVLDLPGRPTP